MKVLKEGSKLYNRILDAEAYLDNLGLEISYYSASDGIVLRDKKTGLEFKTEDREMNFPRNIDTRFIVTK